MKSLREIVEASPQMRSVAMHTLRAEDSAQPLGPALWDWQSVRSVLVVRLRSIGDTVLATPSLFALKRFLPNARVDILLEDWVAPVLEGFEYIDNVITLKRGSTTGRAGAARYDVAYNLHGGTTSTLLTRASGATHQLAIQPINMGDCVNAFRLPRRFCGVEKRHIQLNNNSHCSAGQVCRSRIDLKLAGRYESGCGQNIGAAGGGRF